ncbi:hypothetical protein [Acinetobacter junii]|uniref:hypothetical protein n=1 Tax=Acinetobacter junii TaxID=40215 RepID=UPI0009B8F173|nr:hypothetical protein [Acinetobacter junii]
MNIFLILNFAKRLLGFCGFDTLVLTKYSKTMTNNRQEASMGEFKHEVRQFQKPYDNQQAEQISLMV